MSDDTNAIRPQRVRITNDSGTGYMTRIVDAATGAFVPGVQRAAITLDVHKANTARLKVVMPQVDVVADATYYAVCPCCKRPLDIPADGTAEQPVSKRRARASKKVSKS